MKNTIIPYTGEFCGETCTIYAINCDSLDGIGITTSYRCPYCQKAHIYNIQNPKKVFQSDRYVIAVYDIVCASCNENFEILDIHDKLDD